MISLKEIGRICGLAESTVSKALKDHPLIKEETRRRVQEIARQYNYQPNALVQSIQTGRSRTIGIAYNNFRDPFAGAIMDGITDSLDDAGYEALIICWDKIVAKGARFLTRFSQRRVDGLLLFPSAKLPSAEYLNELRAFQKPIVLIDQTWPGNEFNYVGSDNVEGAALATRHLIERGLKRIGFIRNSPVSTGAERWEGFLAEMRCNGLPVEEDCCPDAMGALDFAPDLIKTALESPRRPEGFVCFNDNCAFNALKAASELGISIPGELSLIGFGDLPLASELARPSLSSMSQQPEKIGRLAASTLLSLMDGGGKVPHELRVPMALVERESVRGVAKGKGRKRP